MPSPAAARPHSRGPLRRPTSAAIVVGVALGASLALPAATASAGGILPPADPATSIPDTAAMVAACYGGGTAAACEAATLSAIDAARADEGVGPMLLPSNYDALPPQQQLLVLVDLERVDRGLAPIEGLDGPLDSVAQAAAVAGEDPVGPTGSTWSANWAGGEASALTTDYDWMYDDGPGSTNVTCPPDCWGHRNAVLTSMPAPALGTGASGGDWTLLFVSDWQGPTSSEWESELSDLHPAVPASVSTATPPGSTIDLDVPVSASGAPATATAVLTSGSPYRVVSPTCTAPAGGRCDLVVAFSPASAGTWDGSLSVVAAGSTSTVALDGYSGNGYWEVTSTGQVWAFGGSGFVGDTASVHMAAPVVGMATTADKGGYWLVGADGGVFSFGDASYLGSTGGMHLNAPIVGMAATPDGRGYWLVGADGGVFSFGDAGFYGSTGGLHLNAPIVGIAPSTDGRGYYLVGADGGVFSFGDAVFRGSTGGLRLDAPVVAMATTPGGYWLAGSDGGVFSFGDAGFHGSMGGVALSAPVVGIVDSPTTGGYWELAADGGVFSFDAPFLGAASSSAPSGRVIGGAGS